MLTSSAVQDTVVPGTHMHALLALMWTRGACGAFVGDLFRPGEWVRSCT